MSLKEIEMNTRRARKTSIVGLALVAAGTVTAAVGVSANAGPTAAQVLPVTGAALLAAGLVSVLRAAALSLARSAVVGSCLVAAGVVVEFIGARAASVEAATSLPAIGGALLAAGTIAIVLATASEPNRSPARPS
jgi:hypothetical protein